MNSLFKVNQANPDKFQAIVLGNTGSLTFQFNNTTIESNLSVTVPGITIISKLNFKEHINNIIQVHAKNYTRLEN